LDRLKGIRLSGKKSQSQKVTYYVIPIIYNILEMINPRDRKQINGCQGIGMNGGGAGKHKGNPCGDAVILYLNFGSGYMNPHM